MQKHEAKIIWDKLVKEGIIQTGDDGMIQNLDNEGLKNLGKAVAAQAAFARQTDTQNKLRKLRNIHG
jgi:hypothetical protein|tara:strand:+ start:972 stop:1172 length:201 start_codon:yes stop_codon:yes gene_type:complete